LRGLISDEEKKLSVASEKLATRVIVADKGIELASRRLHHGHPVAPALTKVQTAQPSVVERQIRGHQSQIRSLSSLPIRDKRDIEEAAAQPAIERQLL
jgi:hypothetical protein